MISYGLLPLLSILLCGHYNILHKIITANIFFYNYPIRKKRMYSNMPNNPFLMDMIEID